MNRIRVDNCIRHWKKRGLRNSIIENLHKLKIQVVYARVASIRRLATCLRLRPARDMSEVGLSVAFSTSVSDAPRMISTWHGWPWYGLIRPWARYVLRRVFWLTSASAIVDTRQSHYVQELVQQRCSWCTIPQVQCSWRPHWTRHSWADEWWIW